MEYPMRMYGTNLYEYSLSLFIKGVSWLCLLLAIAGFIFKDVFYGDPLICGFLSAGLLFGFILLGLYSGGIRQNKATKDTAFLCFIGLGIAFLLVGILCSKPASIIAGAVIVLLFVFTYILRRKAVSARFKPRFFSLRQFETMIQIADTMVDTDGRAVISPIDIAMTVDHMFEQVWSPAAIKEIKLVMFLVEWILPILSFRPFPFSDLGTNERRELVEKVIDAGGIFVNIARVLKLFGCVGYYGNPKGMAQVGYIPFNDRPRAKDESQAPLHYPDPFAKGGPLYGKI